MPYDAWEQYCYTSKWIMDNFPPIDDFHHFYIKIDREREYQETLEFYGNKDFEIEYENFIDEEEASFFQNNDEYEDNQYSSSDSEYDDFEYI